MPEGPELRINSFFINHVCQGLVFGGQPIKSPVSKNPEIEWDSPEYTISSTTRGKELALLLKCLDSKKNVTKRLLFRFGMSGRFYFSGASVIPKHAHLQFKVVSKQNGTKELDLGVLSFVDPRRFGSWHVMDGWGEGRGPDIVEEYELFRENVLKNLEDSIFKKPICEVMLNQKYFNGIGNYLRAEILFRAKIPPFTSTRSVLETLEEGDQGTDVLKLCRDVYQESVQFKIGLGKTENMTETLVADDHVAFMNWLQCYSKPSMNILKDKMGRSVWFHGEPGPMAPKGGKITSYKRKRVLDNPYPFTIATPPPKIKKAKQIKEEEDRTVSEEKREKSRSKEVVQLRRSARLKK